MSVAQRLYEGVETPDGHVGLITYMRTDSLAIAAVAMAEAQAVIASRFGERYGTGKGNVYKTKEKGAQEAHESIRPTSFLRDPDSLRSSLKPDELRLYRLIWQRAIASQMAPKELETTTVELDGRRLPPAGIGHADAVRRLLPASTPRASDDAAEEAERTLPPLKAGDVTSVAGGHADPALHGAPAALHGGDADQGARGARDRPAVHVRRDHLDDRRPRLRARGGAPAAARGDRRDRHGLSSSSTSASTWTSRSRPAWRRSSTRSPAASASGCRCCATFFGPLKERVDEKRKELKRRDFTTEATDEVCSEGHPMVIRLGRNGKFLACSTYPDHKETRPLPGEEAPRLEGDGEPCPQCGEGVLATKRGRFGAFVGCSRYPECTTSRRTARRRRTRCRSRSPAPRTRMGSSSRVARGGPGTSSGGAPATRSATSPPTTSRRARSTTSRTRRTPMAGAPWRARARLGCA